MSLLCATFSWSFAHFQNSAGEGYVIVMHTNMVPKAAWSIHPTLFAWQAYTESNAADLKRRTANSFKPIDSGSHTRTVVRECCKGDNASQWRSPTFDSPPRPNPVSDSNTNRHRWLRRGPLHLCKSSSRSAQACRLRACMTLRTKNVLVFLGFLQLATAKGPGRILTQNSPKHAVPPKDVPFRGREHKI